MQQTIVLPYMRTSALRMPRRDLVITAGDSLTLRATIVEADNPSSQALVLTGGIGGPAARILIHADTHCHGQDWDYGYPYCRPAPARILWCGYGAISTTAIGSFDFFIPFATIGTLPPRCAWTMQMAWDSGRRSETLAQGIMHVSGPAQDTGDMVAWTTDTGQPITDENDVDIFA